MSAATSHRVSDVARIAVLASGGGSNLQALIEAIAQRRLDARIVAVASDRPGCGALERARRAGLATIEVVPAGGEPRHCYDARLAALLADHRPHWIVLAGWMRLLSMPFLTCFPERVVNLHPALPGCFPGTHAIARAHAAFLDGRVDRTGIMVHLVPDEGIDTGPVLAVRELIIGPDESLPSLEARMHALEHELLVDVLAKLCRATQDPAPVSAMEER